MKKEDFKEHKPEYIDTCQLLIDNGGVCSEVPEYVEGSCVCPFHEHNILEFRSCFKNYTSRNSGWEEDSILVESAKEYLAMFNSSKIVVDLDKATHVKYQGQELEISGGLSIGDGSGSSTIANLVLYAKKRGVKRSKVYVPRRKLK